MPIQLNDRITLKNNIPGVVRYIGPVEGRDEEWVGIELDEPRGSNNGCINNKRYFSCSEKHGLFVKYKKLTQSLSAIDMPHTKESGLEPLHGREIFKAMSRENRECQQGVDSSGAFARPVRLSSMHGESSLFTELSSDKILQENHALREENEKYKRIVSLVLEKSSAALDSIRGSLEEVLDRINRLKIRRRTEAERDRVVWLVSQIYYAEKAGNFARDAYNEFKAIMKVHGIGVE